MQRTKSSWFPWLAAGLLALGLTVCPPVRAQDEAGGGEGGESKGRPLDGYIATATLCGLALFIVGKTARR
jgi:hypothetical protein